MKSVKRELALERGLINLTNILRLIVLFQLTVLGVIIVWNSTNIMMLFPGIVLTFVSAYLLIYAWFYFRSSNIVLDYNKHATHRMSNIIKMEIIELHHEKCQGIIDSVQWNEVSYTEDDVDNIALISTNNVYGFTSTNGFYHIPRKNKSHMPWAKLVGKQWNMSVMFNINTDGIVTVFGKVRIPPFFGWLDIVSSANPHNTTVFGFEMTDDEMIEAMFRGRK